MRGLGNPEFLQEDILGTLVSGIENLAGDEEVKMEK